eukprot:Gb_19380 [translate_table: standard]
MQQQGGTYDTREDAGRNGDATMVDSEDRWQGFRAMTGVATLERNEITAGGRNNGQASSVGDSVHKKERFCSDAAYQCVVQHDNTLEDDLKIPIFMVRFKLELMEEAKFEGGLNETESLLDECDEEMDSCSETEQSVIMMYSRDVCLLEKCHSGARSSERSDLSSLRVSLGSGIFNGGGVLPQPFKQALLSDFMKVNSGTPNSKDAEIFSSMEGEKLVTMEGKKQLTALSALSARVFLEDWIDKNWKKNNIVSESFRGKCPKLISKKSSLDEANFPLLKNNPVFEKNPAVTSTRVLEQNVSPVGEKEVSAIEKAGSESSLETLVDQRFGDVPGILSRLERISSRKQVQTVGRDAPTPFFLQVVDDCLKKEA